MPAACIKSNQIFFSDEMPITILRVQDRQLSPHIDSLGKLLLLAFKHCKKSIHKSILQKCSLLLVCNEPSVFWRCWWLGSRKSIRPVKNKVVGCWRDYLSGWGADLYMTQLMTLPLTVSCFWYRLTK